MSIDTQKADVPPEVLADLDEACRYAESGVRDPEAMRKAAESMDRQRRKDRRTPMEIPILIEPVEHHGFRATCGGLWGLETQAPTREEAVRKLRELIDRRLAAGAEVVGLEIRSRTHPLAQFAGMLRGDALLEPWKDAIAEYRRESEDRGE